MSEMIERVVDAVANVILSFTSSEETGHVLKWAILDRNRDDLGVVFVGREHKDGDALAHPYPEIAFELKRAKARAAIMAMRVLREEPEEYRARVSRDAMNAATDPAKAMG